VLAKDCPPNFSGNLTLNLTTIRNVNAKTCSTPYPLTINPREVHTTVVEVTNGEMRYQCLQRDIWLVICYFHCLLR